MAVYEKRSDLNNNNLTQSEVHLYGSSRLGIYNINRDMINPPTGNITTFERGKKFFELANHLGNVLVTVSDRKLQVSAGAVSVDYYTADVVSANDYAPFGMDMPARTFRGGPGSPRYGFNGKERDKDLHSLTAYDYGFRIYNPAIGKFLSVDPLTRGYPMLTPYQFAANSPTAGIDLDGLEFYYTADGKLHDHKTTYLSNGKPIPSNISNQLRVAYNFKDAGKYTTFNYQMFHEANEETRNKVLTTFIKPIYKEKCHHH
jgi:RHS repeat-associated protein